MFDDDDNDNRVIENIKVDLRPKRVMRSVAAPGGRWL